jgi:hypothetical protein
MLRLLVLLLSLSATPVFAQDFDAVVRSLADERAKYGATLNDDECAELVNAVAWKHRADGWGLSGKNFGTHGTLHDGTQVAHDILHHRPTNRIWDVLTGAGAHSTPIRSFGPGGPPPGSNRPWVAPIAPRGAPQPEPPPQPAPTPTPTVDLAPLLAKLDILTAEVASLRGELAAIRSAADTAAFESTNAAVRASEIKTGLEVLPSRITFPAYEGKVLSFSTTLRPKQ